MSTLHANPVPRQRRTPPATLMDDGMVVLPDNVFIVSYPRTDEMDLGMVLIRGVIHAFRLERKPNAESWQHRQEITYAAPGAFGENEVVKVGLTGRTWQCNTCTTHHGLRQSKSCLHCEAARLIAFYHADR